MGIPITEHPNYGAEMAAYQQSKQTAAEAGDQTALSQTELAWANTKGKMADDMFDRQQREQNRQAAIAKAKALVPDIPDEVLANLTTPEAIEQTATALKAQADARQPVTAAATSTPQPAQTWGQGAPTQPAQQQQGDEVAQFHKNMTELAHTVEKDAGRNPAAVEQFGHDYFHAFMGHGMVKKSGERK